MPPEDEKRPKPEDVARVAEWIVGQLREGEVALDPLGVAFDNYDAIGRWRTVETVRDGTGADPALDPSGTLADGRTFADARALKQLLLADLDKFAAAFTDKLATYALRRGMTFSDREELKRIAEQAKGADYHLASLIESFVTGPLFQKR